MNGKAIKKNNKGLTLLEVLVAAFILALVALPLLNMFVLSTAQNKSARQKTQLTYNAKAQMESLYNKTYSQLFTSQQTKIYNASFDKYVTIKVEPSGAFDSLVSGTPCYMHLILNGTTATTMGPDGKSYPYSSMSNFKLLVSGSNYTVQYNGINVLTGSTNGRSLFLIVNAGNNAIISTMTIDAGNIPYALYARSTDNITMISTSSKREYTNDVPPMTMLINVTCLFYATSTSSTPDGVIQNTFSVARP